MPLELFGAGRCFRGSLRSVPGLFPYRRILILLALVVSLLGISASTADASLAADER
jgi:hypothetical protein